MSGHDQFTVRFVRSINAWVTECKDCGWLGVGHSHPLDVGDEMLEHTANPEPASRLSGSKR